MKSIRHNILIFSLITVLVFLLAGTPVMHGAKTSKAKFTLVIDAGHGGKDPGAQGNGVNEKDINLGVALKLGEFIKKNLKDVRVIYTRDKDEYLTLQQRADKANKNGADLFISLHVNSLATDNPRRISAVGSSVHVLGQSKDRKNADVVKRENSVIKLEKGYHENYQGFDPDSDESYIIFEMMQKRQQERSLDLAQEVQKQLKAVAGRRDRGVTQEPFWVLWATSMPAVLVEMDYICNPNSAKYLASTTGQNKIAKALFNAVRVYYQQELALARQPKPAPVQEEPLDDGRTYVGDGYAIIASPASPERKVSGSGHTAYAHRTTGTRRRSAQARATSAAKVREQDDVNVRTYSEPASISQRPKPQPAAQSAQVPSPEPRNGKNASKKPGKTNRARNVGTHHGAAAKPSTAKSSTPKPAQANKDSAKPDKAAAKAQATTSPKAKKAHLNRNN